MIKMVTTAKTQVISDGRIAIPDDWANSVGLDDGTSVSLSLSDSKIIIEKTHHPLEDMCSLLDDIEFTDSDFIQAKKSLFPFEDTEEGNSKRVYDLLDDNTIYVLDAQALFQLHKRKPPSAVKKLRDDLIKEKCTAIIPIIAIAELLWKCRRSGITDRVERLLNGWKRSPNIIIEPFSLEILELMVENRDSYELHDEIIAMTCRKYNTKLICTKDEKLIRTYNLTKVWD